MKLLRYSCLGFVIVLGYIAFVACEGTLPMFVDGDGDGYGSKVACTDEPVCVANNADCDDGDATEYPGVIWAVDVDVDGYGDNSSLSLCERVNPNDVPNADDCDDSDGAINPGATETPNDDIDQDCDGGDLICTDEDSDNFYAESGCGTAVDCDDGDPAINPGAVEIDNNGVDENCDGIIEGTRFSDMGDGTVRDEDSGLIWLKDASCSDLASTDSLGRAGWQEATDVVRFNVADGICGLKDGSVRGVWRLPTQVEWAAFLDRDYSYPALCNAAGDDQWEEGDAFDGVVYNFYWSFDAYDEIYAWVSGTRQGTAAIFEMGELLYIWPVRPAN
jgi:hypothetical protein